MTNLYKTLVLGLAVGISIPVIKVYKDRHNAHLQEAKRVEYEKFLAAHPYNLHREAVSEGGEEDESREHAPDRPDLACEQDLLRTMDPALQYAPTERLRSVYTAIKQQKNSASPLSSIVWTERGPSNVGGRTNAIMYDPNDATRKKVWAGGSTGGLWYCNDITTLTPVWHTVDDFWANLAVTWIASDPGNPQVFYVGTGDMYAPVRGGGIWKTTNGGTTWNMLASTSGSNFYYVNKVIVHPVTHDVYACTKTGGLQRSQDGGATWSAVLSLATGAQVDAAADIEIGADNTIYVAMGVIYYQDGIYKSATGNQGSWTYTSNAAKGFASSGYEKIEIAVSPVNANVIYAMLQDASTRDLLGIYRSSDKGTNWTLLTMPVDGDNGISPSITRGQGWYDLIMAVDPNDANTVLIGGIDIFKTSDAGSSWTQLTHWYGGFGFPYIHADQHAIVYQPGSSTTVLFGNDGGVFRSQDITSATPAFTDRNSSYNVTQFYSCAINPTAASDNFIAGAQDNGTQQFTIAGVNATTQVYGGDGAYCFIDQDNPSIQIASYVYNNFYLSTDGGNNFSTPLVQDQTTGSFINPADYDDRENILYATSTSSSIMRILNVSGSPLQSDISVAIGSKSTHIRVSPYAPAGKSTIFVGTQSGRVFKITNAESMSPATAEITGPSFSTGSVSCIEVGASENELLVTFSNYGVVSVWYTADGGASWSNKEGSLPDMPVRWALFNPNNRKEVLLATEVGVWSTADISVGSPTWLASNMGLANVRTDMLQIRSSDRRVIAATHGRGLFSTDAFAGTGPFTADFTANNTTTCANTSVTFTSTSTGTITGYAWDFGSGASPATANTAGPHTVTYSTSGPKTIKLKITGPSGADSTTKTNYVNVNAAPSLSVNVTHVSCNGAADGSAALTASGGAGGYTYAWQGGGSGTSKSNIPPGTYSATVTDALGCFRSVSFTITQPLALTGLVSTSSTSCTGNTGTASITVGGGTPGYTYSWSSGATTPSVTGLAKGPYQVAITDSHGCTLIKSFTVADNNSIVINTGSPRSICRGGTVVMGANPVATGGSAPYAYNWTPSTTLINSTSGNPSASPSASTTYNLVVTDAGGCSQAGNAVVTVLPDLNPSFTSSVDTIGTGFPVSFTGAATGATGWSWTFGDGGVSSLQSPSHSYANVGSFPVKLVVSNGACSDSVTHPIVVQLVGIANATVTRMVRLYPNPVSRQLTVELNGAAITRMYMLNLLGQEVLVNNKPSGTEKIDVSGLKEGSYYLKLETAGGPVTYKISVLH